ncbi:MAG: DUF2190 family protein [Rubrivivax sp.]|jgi:hypothetical protein|nr:DUF2190 family protein [Rubrivivax sp.]
MTMRIQGLVKTFNSGAAIARSRIVQFGADERTVIQSSAATSSHIGVADDVATPGAGEPVEVVMAGVATVEYGAAVTRGALLTSDASGRAIVAAAAAGANVRTVGVAMVDGVLGDLGAVRLHPGSFQG